LCKPCHTRLQWPNLCHYSKQDLEFLGRALRVFSEIAGEEVVYVWYSDDRAGHYTTEDRKNSVRMEERAIGEPFPWLSYRDEEDNQDLRRILGEVADRWRSIGDIAETLSGKFTVSKVRYFLERPNRGAVHQRLVKRHELFDPNRGKKSVLYRVTEAGKQFLAGQYKPKVRRPASRLIIVHFNPSRHFRLERVRG
jgi:hypothetical protein